MKTRVIVLVVIMALLALPMVANAQATDPVAVTEGHVEAVNNGDVEAAGDVVADDAAVTVPAVTTTGTEAEGEGETEAEGEPEAATTYTGAEEVEVWLEAQVAAKANINLEGCSVAGELVTCAAGYTSEALMANGIDSLEGTLEVTVVDGLIQAYDFTPSAESVAEIQAASAPQTLPVSGGTTPTQTTNYMMLVGLMLLLAGAATYSFQRRGNKA